jgi:outer membrane protein insertion porin family/translocation and assembly module TamA
MEGDSSSMFRNWAVGRLALIPLFGIGGKVAVAVAQDRDLIIRQFKFEGNHSVEAIALEAAISTTKSSWFARSPLVRDLGLGEKRRLNEREFRVDVARIRLFYQLSGFLNAKVDTVVRRTERDVYITFKITEGEPIRVRSVAITGIDSVPDRAAVARDLPLRVGMPFNRYRLLASADTVQVRLWNRGYPTASVLFARRPVDTADRTAREVELVVDLGQPAKIGSIRVEGTRAVDSGFVRRLLATRSGRPFRYDELYRSQLNLYQSGLFRFATVGTDTTRFSIGDPTVPLLIQIQEGPLHRARSSLGLATNDCLRAAVGWTARNVGGRGRQLDFTGQVSKIGVETQPLRSTVCNRLDEDTIGSGKVNYGVTASLRRPAFISPANAITGSLFAERRSEFKVYRRDDVGASATFTREGALGVPLSLAYRISYGATEANAVVFCAFFLACRSDDVAQLSQRRFAASLTGSITRQRVNNLLDPTRGSVYTLETSFSSPLIGSNRFSEYTRVVGEASWYRPLGSDVVLATHLKGGLTFAPRLRLTGSTGNFIPPDQRFYAGGANDVRGYDRNQLGPVVYVTPSSNIDSTGAAVDESLVEVAPTGGNSLVLGNVELRLPSPFLTDRLRWALFVDGGGVWERGGGADPFLRVTPGFGMRFATALGPMRFDLAYNRSDLPTGVLFGSDSTSALVRVRDDYRKRVSRSFPFNIQISVGQAF